MGHYSDLAYAYGKPSGSAVFKSELGDFQVEELLPFALSGEGEHLWLFIEKYGENTDWLIQQIAKFAGLRVRDVGYAGLKDRQGITRQWLSLYLPGKPDPDFHSWQMPSVKVLQTLRHNRKLQIGALKANRFQIRLRQVTGLDEILTRLSQIQVSGVPNYFGEQRFGRNEHNLVMAQKLFDGELTRLKPAQRSLYLSSARSYLFNQVLSQRVANKTWNQACKGDIFQLEGSEKWFIDDGSNDLAQRVNHADIHPTGPLVGGAWPADSTQMQWEQQVLKPNQAWLGALTEFGLKHDRRALRFIPQDLSWKVDAPSTAGSNPHSDLILNFTLGPGRYATALLREVCQIRQVIKVL